mmetsp:Transcript_22261/g.34097  ORF Transcript_22261/g.34097 Transcript_22261/m.34097 type:complete len:102 (+) Transcript_22261:353-658(+)
MERTAQCTERSIEKLAKWCVFRVPRFDCWAGFTVVSFEISNSSIFFCTKVVCNQANEETVYDISRSNAIAGDSELTQLVTSERRPAQGSSARKQRKFMPCI